MIKKIFVYSDFLSDFLIKEIMQEFNTSNISKKTMADNNFNNQNIFLIIKNNSKVLFGEDFFIRNNVLILSLRMKKNIKEIGFPYTSTLYGPINISNLSNRIKIHFSNKVFNFLDIKLYGEKMVNYKNGQSCFLTVLEKKILMVLVDKKKITKEYFLENILEINKGAETRTAESHLTRIRKKLHNINSDIQISSRSESFFLEG